MKTHSHLRLVLFDIDGTLISTNGIARQCFADAIDSTFQFNSSARTHDFRGKTDQLIYHEIMTQSQLPEHIVEGKKEAVFEKFYELLKAQLSEENVTVHEGVRELLDELAQDGNVTLGLLTGNMLRGARIKLAPPKLNEYFAFGAFGSDAQYRYELPTIAVERAYKRNGYQYRDKEIVVVGDTEHDIECGRHLNVRTIAVATGGTSIDDLSGHNPDFLFSNMTNTDALLDAILD